MSDREFYSRYESLFGFEPTEMVKAQVKRLKNSYSYQQIFNALWYFYFHKGASKDSISTYGIGLLSNSKNMDEAQNYFNWLAALRKRAKASAEQAKEVETKTIITKRQKQRIRREEFDWDE